MQRPSRYCCCSVFVCDVLCFLRLQIDTVCRCQSLHLPSLFFPSQAPPPPPPSVSSGAPPPPPLRHASVSQRSSYSSNSSSNSDLTGESSSYSSGSPSVSAGGALTAPAVPIRTSSVIRITGVLESPVSRSEPPELFPAIRTASV